MIDFINDALEAIALWLLVASMIGAWLGVTVMVITGTLRGHRLTTFASMVFVLTGLVCMALVADSGLVTAVAMIVGVFVLHTFNGAVWHDHPFNPNRNDNRSDTP